MKKLQMCGWDCSYANQLTQEVRYTDERIRNWGTTQVWTWDDGDAIVIIVGSFDGQYHGTHGTPIIYVVIRVGNDVKVVEANSVKQAMAIVGLNPDEYEVV